MPFKVNPITGKLDYYEAAAAGSSPLTTKGDIYTYATTNVRLPVGTNGQTLVADSAETTGLKWVSAVQAFDGGNYEDTYVDTSDFDAGAY